MLIQAIVKGVIVGALACLAVVALVAAVKGAKGSSRGSAAAFLAIFLQFFGGGVPPPRQTIEDAREADEKKRSEDSGAGEDRHPRGVERD